jgi:hypothetical protein
MTGPMPQLSVTGRPAAARRPAGLEIIRRTSLGMSVALLVQYGLGMWVSLYVTVPGQDQGGGEFAAIGRALSNGPAALAVHAALGLLLLLGSVVLVVRAAAARSPFLIVTTAVSLLATAGAAASGGAFVNAGQDGASLGMALLTGVALLAQVVNLYWLGTARGSAR